MGRKTRNPGKKMTDAGNQPYRQDRFDYGMVRNDNPRNMPALADAFNAVVYPHHVEGRTGSVLYTPLAPPPLPDTPSFGVVKTGALVSAAAPVFTRAHVSCYVVFPGDPSRHYEIIEYRNQYQVLVDSETAEANAVCTLRGPLNVWHQHIYTKKWVRQWGWELWVYNAEMTSRSRVLIVSTDTPANSRSTCSDMDERSVVVFNSNGSYRIDLETTPYTAWRMNTPVPTERIDTEPETPDALYQYHLLYSCARLSGTGALRSRLDPIRIEQESGPNKVDATTYDDYTEIWTPEPVGPGDTTYQVLVCAPLVAPYDTIEAWLALLADPDDVCTFQIDVDGWGVQEITVSITTCGTMPALAAAIQASLQDWFPDVTCMHKVTAGAGYFEIGCKRVAGRTITVAADGVTGINIAGHMMARAADGAHVVDRKVGVPHVVETLYVPKNSKGQLEQHWTHFPIWRTGDLRNQYKLGVRPSAFNDPNRFTWDHDLRIAAAFVATRMAGLVTAEHGIFEREDVGSVLEWENGERDTILEYVDEYRVVVAHVEYYYDYYRGACAIGNGRVFRATQTGNVVTVLGGATFTSADVRKTLFWSDGGRSYVKRYLSAVSVEVYDSQERTEYGATMDPSHRNYCICTTDATLRARISSLLLANRFWSEMQTANCGAILPGFMLTVRRGQQALHYCQLPDGMNYLAGYHNPGYQINTQVTDDIQAILVTQSVFALLCSNRTWGGSTNNAEIMTVPDAGEAVAVLGGVDIVDGNIGVFDWGSIQPVGEGQWMMITSEPGGRGLRKFNGQSYGENEAVLAADGMNKIADDLGKLQQATATLYSGRTGYVLWGKR